MQPDWFFSNNVYLASSGEQDVLPPAGIAAVYGMKITVMNKQSDINIGHRSKGYQVLKNLARAAFYIYFRKISIYGRENIPGDGGLIFAANHRNALIDALAVLLTNSYQPVYLARADIFRNPVAARILRFLKIMPVYRFRDGVETMGQNEDTFMKTTEVLSEGGCIGIMPEGNHGEQKRLRVLKKGVFRIAFRAMEDSGCNVRIVPVGLDYTDTDRFREELVVNYGEPLSVKDYFDLYREHPQKGINAMRKDLSDRMRTLIIDITDESNYRVDRLLMDIGTKAARGKSINTGEYSSGRFILQSELCKAMYEYFDREPAAAKELRDKAMRLLELLDKHGIHSPGDCNPDRKKLFFARVIRVLCFPVFLAGAVVHILPLALIRLALGKLKDLQFISSFKFVLGFLLVPLNYLIAAVVLFSIMPVKFALPVVIAMPLLGIIAHKCYRISEAAALTIGCSRAASGHPADFADIARLREEITVKLEPVLGRLAEKYSRVNSLNKS